MLADQQALMVCSLRGRKQLESDPLLAQALQSTQRLVWMDAVEANPDLHHLQDQAKSLLEDQVDCVVAFGGGSAIDAGTFHSLAIKSR
jgi:alcohol dehydrogenase class IV